MQPQTCTKCGTLPQDILMLACNHDLCLNCAAQRLSFQSKKKTATGIVCQFCNQKTQLDSESVYELEKIMIQIQSKRAKKQIKDPNPKSDIDSRRIDKYQRQPLPPRTQEREKKSDYGVQFKSGYTNNQTSFTKQAKQPTSSYGGLNKKNCSQHPDEELLYFCFDCNSECICPECVIHGKHKNHEVKTLKKSQPIIKGRLQNFLQNIDNNVEGLLMKKNQFQKHIKDMTQQNNICKKQIQKSFADLKTRITNKQKQIIGKCDKALEMTIQQYQRGIKAVVRKVEQIKQSSQMIAETLKKEELVLLNFYARKNSDLQEIVKRVDLDSFVRADAERILKNTSTLEFINELSSEVVKLDIDSSIKYDPKYDDKPNSVVKLPKDDYEEQNQYSRSTKQKYRDEYQRKY